MHHFRHLRFYIVTLCLAIIVITHYLGWLIPLEQGLRILIKPSLKLIYQKSAFISNDNTQFNNIKKLRTAYLQLKQEHSKFLVDQVELQLLKEENEELRKQLSFLRRSNYKSVGATVIAKEIEPLRHTIILDQGSRAGVQLNYPVIVGQGMLVGKIIRTESDMSVVQLLHDHQSKVAATILNQEKSVGLVEGGYGISIRLNFIPQNESVQVGDVIITSGLESYLPYGLLIGTIATIEKEAYQPFQRAVITPSANLANVQVVSIIISDH